MPSPPPADDRPAHVRHEFREASDAEARALASGLRLRILRMTLDEALTNQEIARALGRSPASVLHHVRTLTSTGYLRAEEPRRGARGAKEIPYRSTGKSWYVNSAAGAGDSMLEAFLGELQAAPVEERQMTRLGVRLSPADLEDFLTRLHALLDEVHDRPRDPSGQPWSVFLAVHPDTSVPPGVTASGHDPPGG